MITSYESTMVFIGIEESDINQIAKDNDITLPDGFNEAQYLTDEGSALIETMKKAVVDWLKDDLFYEQIPIPHKDDEDTD